jgi:uncharacterized membrane protein
MAKIGRKGRLWLKGFHQLFFILWIGAAVSANTIGYLTGNADSGEQLHAYYLAINGLDVIILPSAILTLVTGILLIWLAGWGFKHFFVWYSLGVMIIAIILGPVILGPSTSTLLDLADTQGLQALQNTEYEQARQLLTIVSTIQIVLLISAAFICTIKPSSKRRAAPQPRDVAETATA